MITLSLIAGYELTHDKSIFIFLIINYILPFLFLNKSYLSFKTNNTWFANQLYTTVIKTIYNQLSKKR